MIEVILFAGTFAFWVPVFLFLLFMTWAIGDDSDSAGAFGWVFLFLFGVALALFTDFNPFAWIRDNPIGALMLVAIYGGAGAVWSVFKWIAYANSRKRYFKENEKDIRGSFETARSPKSGRTVPYTGSFEAYVQDHYQIPPKALNNKARIVGWISWWPFSVVYTFFKDIFVRFFTWIYDRLSGTYDRITRRIFSDIDLSTPPAPPAPPPSNQPRASVIME